MVAAWFLALAFGVPGTYGVSIAAVGMLSITGMIVSSDAYGPIVDNAKGCAEYGGLDEETIRVCDRLDAAGNTAKAITKGFAIGAAALTVLALFAAYVETVELNGVGKPRPAPIPLVMVGVFIGAMMPPLFSALTMLSVSRNAFKMVEEIRRQFREIPGLLEGKVPPDSAKCVDIATAGRAQGADPAGASGPGHAAGGGHSVLGPSALGGFLAGSIVTGILFALLMANAGGLWDNAKKYIEDGAMGGKGSDAHKAAVVGDTVGDPFKDTAGPSLNTLITVMSLVRHGLCAVHGQVRTCSAAEPSDTSPMREPASLMRRALSVISERRVTCASGCSRIGRYALVVGRRPSPGTWSIASLTSARPRCVGLRATWCSKPLLADIVQQLLESGHLDDAVAAKGVHLVVGDLAFAQIGADAPILVVGRDAAVGQRRRLDLAQPACRRCSPCPPCRR